MAFFGLSDISFNKGATDRKGPLGDLVDTQFKTSTLRYPIDLGNYDKGHYMVFYIRQQAKTSFPAPLASESTFTSTDALGKITAEKINLSVAGTNLGGELLGKINSGLASLNSATGGALSGVTGAISGAAGNIVGGINNLFGQKATSLAGDGAETTAIIDNSIKRITGGSLRLLKTQLTTDAIALYMPDTLVYTYQQQYDTPSIGESGLGKAMGAAASVFEDLKKGNVMSAGGTAFKAAAGEGVKSALNKFGSGGAGDAAFAGLFGVVSNPMLEMIYKSPQFRTFSFEFMFYPRDEKEAYEVQKIIERFRFHQAPEKVKPGNFLMPPSEFDVKFYYGGKENPNLPQITTCVLQSIDTNYAPNGWSAYEVPTENSPAIGRTGMPTAIQMTLSFQEVTYLTKEDFKSEHDSVGTTDLGNTWDGYETAKE